MDESGGVGKSRVDDSGAVTGTGGLWRRGSNRSNRPNRPTGATGATGATGPASMSTRASPVAEQIFLANLKGGTVINE